MLSAEAKKNLSDYAGSSQSGGCGNCMMEMYSEDNEFMTSSLLLSSVLNIKYTGGNSGLRKFCKTRPQKKILLFLDVVPDNTSTVNLYNIMKQDIVENQLEDFVYLFPIVCTEYLIIRMLKRLGIFLEFSYPWMTEVEQAISELKTIEEYVPFHVCRYKESFRSFEKQCKLLLNNSQMRFHNVNMNTKQEGEEYRYISFYLNNSDGLSTCQKAVELAKEYPAIVWKEGIEWPENLENTNDFFKASREAVAFTDSWLKKDIKKSLGEKWWESY